MAIPNPVFLYHITALPNLKRIVADGALRSKALLARDGTTYSNIAYQGAQGRRAIKRVELPPGGVIHDYVPFYFAPRSPMLFTINNGNVPNCSYRQEDIIHVVTDVDKVKKPGKFVFYNYNATLSIAQCYNDIANLDQIDWDLFFEPPRVAGYCKYWHSRVDDSRYVRRMETRQAEFLVHEAVPLDRLRGIGTYDDAKARSVRAILRAAGNDLPVEAMPGWYF